MMTFNVLFFALVITVSVDSAPEWNDLRVTWGLNVQTDFQQQPRTALEAQKQGFHPVGFKTCNGSGVYNGFAYAKDEDYALTLLYDIKGYIAGIQIGVTQEQYEKTGYPSTKIQPPFVHSEERYVLTAYFTDPSRICTRGRTQQQFETEGTGTDLWIQTGNRPTDVTRIPKKEMNVSSTKWSEGKCFVSMGKHYWYDIKVGMDCEAFFPVFLLYNGGKLNAFGWALLADLQSSHYEHPGVSVIGAFMKQVPHCVSKITHRLSTMHIYLTSTPMLDAC